MLNSLIQEALIITFIQTRCDIKTAAYSLAIRIPLKLFSITYVLSVGQYQKHPLNLLNYIKSFRYGVKLL